jgi:sugar phosphate permease
VSGFVSRLIQNRRRPIILGCAILTMLALLLMAVAMWHSGAARWLEAALLLLGLASSSSPIACAAIKEVNPQEVAGIAIGISNSAAYLGIAILSNLAGLIMDAFGGMPAPGGIMVYPRAAYFTVMIGCMMMAALSCRMAWKMRESRGMNVYGVPRA